ncbi:MAG: transglutaminase domain-containing protein [Ferruginibacter sp.]
MKLLLFLCFYIYCGPILRGQGFNDFAGIDRKAGNIPAGETYSTSSIAGYVQSNFKTDLEKLRAIYTWVITNIRYDKDSMYHINWSMDPGEKISATLRRRKGVCENYAALFTDIAIKSGFKCFVVNGFTNESGSVNRAGHSWCAVSLQQQWYLCDPTWDVGCEGNTKYFLANPAQFIETHIPFDPLWQLLENPLTENDFSRGFFHSKKSHLAFNFSDSVKAFLQLDSLRQLEAASRRIREAGIENERQKDWLAYNQMKIAIIYGENDMNLYNSAVTDLNNANAIFNDFVQYRNNRFIPVRPDTQINALLDPIPVLLSSALKKLDQMGQAVENFQYDAGTIKNRLGILAGRVKEQQIFLERYIASSVAERRKLFYR